MIKIGLIGCGNIGSFIAEELDKEKEFNLTAVMDVDEDKCKRLINKLNNKPIIVNNIDNLINNNNLIVEAASQEVVREYCLTVLEKGVDFLSMSVGAFGNNELLKKAKEKAQENNCYLYLPSGAVCGIDGIKSSSVGKLSKVILTTTKPPKGLTGVKYLDEKGINVNNLTEKTIVFEGPAREAVKLFPKNINISTVLSLSGLGLDETIVKIIVDPTTNENTHEVFVEGDCGVFNIKLNNKPSPHNPKTSYLACLSAVKTIKDIVSRVKIGT